MAEEEESAMDTIRDLMRREPFVPFAIVMTSGDRYLIEDPYALAIGSSQLHYFPRAGKEIRMRINQVAVIEGSQERPAA